jgi:DNA primase
MNTIDPNYIKEQVSLVELLARLGFHPVRPAGREAQYYSMLRDSDTTPSFSVNDKLGVWYDHGLGQGGNIIDFGIAYWKLPFRDTLEKIVEVTGMPPTGEKQPKRRHALKLPHYQVEEAKEPGNNPAITAYLHERGLWQAAAGRLKEVYYYVEDEKKRRKHFFAAGHQNETGGWEVRSKYFKGCLGHKALTIVPGSADHVCIFEGYFNYLSWLTENDNAGTVIVTNSIALLPQAISKARAFATIDLFFDNDPGGRNATAKFIQQLPHAVDRSGSFEGYNDYNEKITASLIKQKPGIFQQAFSRY